MDRRINKTQKLIKNAFSALIAKKRYSEITIQDILNEADIGRATFYAHFKTKEQVLSSICSDIFLHISSESLHAEKHHDFSEQRDFRHVITHMLCHLQEDKQMLKGILSSEGSSVFLESLKNHLYTLISQWLTTENITETVVPFPLLLNHLITSLMEIILWWIDNSCEQPTEKIADYYFALILPILKEANV